MHKALDQIGAFAGPLLVAALIAANNGDLRPALAVLAVPGALAIALLVLTRNRAPQPTTHDTTHRTTRGSCSPRHGASHPRPGSVRPVRAPRQRLPAPFLRLAAGTALCTAGLLTFGLISFHIAARGLLPTAGIPLLYAAAMAAGALAALATGELYDRIGARVLLALPLLVAAVPALAFGGSLAAVVPGVLLWGAGVGVQDSTVKALVADLVPRERRATAYGVFAAVQGAGALLGGVTAGALYQHSVTALVVVTLLLQALALTLLVTVTHHSDDGTTRA